MILLLPFRHYLLQLRTEAQLSSSVTQLGTMSDSNDQTPSPGGPHLPFQARLAQGETVSIDGTNVVRVPFGVRRTRRERPQRPENWHTLVLPLQRFEPTPPPQAA